VTQLHYPKPSICLAKTVRWGHIGTAGPALMRVVIG
jgi:hypothetical protein